MSPTVEVGNSPAFLPLPWREAFSAALKLPRGSHRAVRFLARRCPGLHEVLLQGSAAKECYIDLRETICTQLFFYGCYPHQSGQDRLLRELILPGQTVFDIGANIGFYTRLFAEAAGPAGTVVAAEPGRRALRLLRRNASLCRSATHVVAKAVGATEGRVRFIETEDLDLSYCAPGGEGREVESTTVDRMAGQFGAPDLIKIDVEGFEDAVLSGARQTLASNHAPLVMFEQIVELAQRSAGCGLRQVVERFPAYRYRVFRVRTNGSLAPLDSEEGAGFTHDCLAVPLERLAEVAPFSTPVVC